MEGGGTALPCPGAGSGSQRSLGDVFWYKLVSGGATWQSLNPAGDFGQGRDVEPDRAQHIPGAGTSSTPGSTGGPLLFILLELAPSQGELPPHPARGAAGCSCHRRDRATPGEGFGEPGRAAPGVPTPCVTPRENLLIVPSQDTGWEEGRGQRVLCDAPAVLGPRVSVCPSPAQRLTRVPGLIRTAQIRTRMSLCCAPGTGV